MTKPSNAPTNFNVEELEALRETCAQWFLLTQTEPSEDLQNGLDKIDQMILIGRGELNVIGVLEGPTRTIADAISSDAFVETEGSTPRQ